ncbi:MAG: DEAD/DEAH box helicase [bacterium]
MIDILAENTNRDIKKDRFYPLQIEREWLEAGIIPLNSFLRKIIPDRPEDVTITFLDENDNTYELIVDNQEEIIIGEGVEKLVDINTSSFLIRVVDDEELIFKIKKMWQFDSDSGVEFADSVVDSIDNVNEIWESLQYNKFNDKTEYQQHLQAHNLTFEKGFDKLISLPALKNLEPFDYQLDTARQVLQEMRGRALLADEVGLGKTIEAGIILMEYIMRRLVNKVLILTPPSLVQQWQEEMQRKFNLRFVSYDSKQFRNADNGWEQFDKVIASLYTAKREKRSKKIEKINYDMIIVDEAHHLKNKSTQNWKFVNKLKKKFILLLTATPVQNKLEELFNLITLLRPGQLETSREFKRKYITRGDRLKPKNPDELKNLVRKVMVRNKRSNNKILLTQRYARILDIELSNEEKEFYRELSTLIKKSFQDNNDLNKLVLKTLQKELGSSIKAVLPTLEKITNRDSLSSETKQKLLTLLTKGKNINEYGKLQDLIKLINNLEGKILLFTTFRNTQDFLYKKLKEEGIAVTRFHGQQTRAAKEEAVNSFREEKKVLVSTESGGEGRNLQFCNKMINYDLPWNPMKIEQRIGRIHRIGQERDVYIYNFSAKDTIEAHILEILDAKINMFELVIGELDMILGNMQERRDFEDIVMDIWVNSSEETEIKEKMNEFGDNLAAARKKYEEVKQYDEKLFGDMLNDEG